MRLGREQPAIGPVHACTGGRGCRNATHGLVVVLGVSIAAAPSSVSKVIVFFAAVRSAAREWRVAARRCAAGVRPTPEWRPAARTERPIVERTAVGEGGPAVVAVAVAAAAIIITSSSTTTTITGAAPAAPAVDAVVVRDINLHRNLLV
jgi:hypothetical protein